MNDAVVLNKIINEKAKLLVQTKNARSFVELIEEQCPECKVVINNIPNDSIVIKLSKFPDFQYFLNSPDEIIYKKGICKKADYIIISEEKKCILYIELKKKKDEENKIIKQLIGAKCCCTYLKEIGKNFYEVENFLSNYKDRYVAFYYVTMKKRGSAEMHNYGEVHSNPKHFLRVSYHNSIQFNEIASLSKN